MMAGVLKANRNEVFASVLTWVMRQMVRQRFRGIYLENENLVQAVARQEQALLAVCNHTNWWDGFVAAIFTAHLRRKFYVGQENRHLAQYGFMRHFGAFGIDLECPARHLAMFRHVLELLRDDLALIWIFPQGRLTSPQKPIRVKKGAGLISRRSKTPILTCAFRYEFRQDQAPSIVIGTGAILTAGASDQEIESELQAVADRLAGYADPDRPLPRTTLVKSAGSLNEKIDRCFAVFWPKVRR